LIIPPQEGFVNRKGIFCLRFLKSDFAAYLPELNLIQLENSQSTTIPNQACAVPIQTACKAKTASFRKLFGKIS